MSGVWDYRSFGLVAFFSAPVVVFMMSGMIARVRKRIFISAFCGEFLMPRGDLNLGFCGFVFGCVRVVVVVDCGLLVPHIRAVLAYLRWFSEVLPFVVGWFKSSLSFDDAMGGTRCDSLWADYVLSVGCAVRVVVRVLVFVIRLECWRMYFIV